MTRSKPKLEVHPLTPARWRDFEALFGPRGACGGCWCMTPRLPRAQYALTKGDANKRAMKKLVDAGAETGLIGYVDRKAVAWLALAPRAHYLGLAGSRVMKPIDDRPAWTIACLFIAKEHRGRGLAPAMISAALKHARARGATLVEACPHEPRLDRMPDVFAWAGIASSFFANGFEEIARRSKSRPYVRKELSAKRGTLRARRGHS